MTHFYYKNTFVKYEKIRDNNKFQSFNGWSLLCFNKKNICNGLINYCLLIVIFVMFTNISFVLFSPKAILNL